LVVDEAQRLTRHAMEVLRYFYDDPDTQLALLLVGGDGCWETISREPMLASRVYRQRRFGPFRSADVPSLMQA
jgi:DNA transposition AAA+ family ATPase